MRFTSGATPTADVSDRIARILGRVSALGSALGASSQKIVGPAINTVFADTGALPAGTYHIRVFGSGAVATGTDFWELQHRDAANAANIRVYAFGAPIGLSYAELTITLAINERVRIILVTAAASAQAAGLVWERLDA